MTGEERKQLQTAFDDEVVAAIGKFGPDHDKTPLIKKYVALGINQATVYRWYSRVIASGRPGLELADTVAAAAEERASRTPEPATEAAREVVAIIPKPPRVDEVVSSGVGAVIDKLQTCMGIADELMAHARTAEGKPRNVKLLLAASEHLRRTIDTTIRLQEAVNEVSQVEAFQRAVFDVLREEDPGMVERVLKRLRQLNEQWRSGRA
jgi:hypothetical protein